jgi:anti-anti-sigma factor
MDRIPDFSVTVESPAAGRAVLTVRGELDLASAEILREPLVEALSTHSLVVLEMSGCPFLDSSGLRALLAGVRRADEAGSALRLCGAGPEVARVIELTAVQSVLRVYPDVPSALAAD